jgi:hypothetical protein
MDNLSVVLELFLNSLEVPILKLGNSPVTLRAILQMLVLVALLYYLSGKLRTLIAERFLIRTRMELGARQATGSIIRYIILAIGFAIIFQTPASISRPQRSGRAGWDGLRPAEHRQQFYLRRHHPLRAPHQGW